MVFGDEIPMPELCERCGVIFYHIHASPSCEKDHRCNGDLMARVESISRCDRCRPSPRKKDMCARCQGEAE